MLVRAIEMGYAGKDGHALRQPGEQFEIEDELAKVALARPQGTWYVPVETEKPKRGKAEDTLV